MRQVINFNKDWKFNVHNTDINLSYVSLYDTKIDLSDWQDVTLPHDSSINSEFSPKNISGPRCGYAKSVMCYYAKKIDVSKEQLSKKTIIEFEGVYMNSTVYINGHELGTYPYGYTAFRYELTPYLIEGENLISVRVDNEAQPSSRWYSGTGIYRPVNLYVVEKTYFEFDELFIKTPYVTDKTARIDVSFDFLNTLVDSTAGDMTVSIFDAEKNIALKASKTVSIAGGSKTHQNFLFDLDDPKLWCNRTPYLYDLQVEFIANGEVVDKISSKFGVRSIEFTPDRGLIVNGSKELLKGVCIHHDNGALGACAEKTAMKRKIEVLKQMGANAIRTSHNPESKDFLDLCDEYGMYVYEEAFDEWKTSKRPRVFGEDVVRRRIFGYAQYFNEWAEKDLSAMIKRDRNHPSIILWGIGNEIEELHHTEGEKTAQYLTNIIKQHDITRPTSFAGNCVAEVNGTLSPDIVDVCGYNYGEPFYEEVRKTHPNRRLVGSETSTITFFEKRGMYDEFFDTIFREAKDLEEAGNDSNGLMNDFKGLVRDRIEKGEYSYKLHNDNPHVAGFFIWTGIDYLGEPSPFAWPYISSSFAPIDRALFPKDAFYFYKSAWSDEDVLHIFPHWNLKQYKGKPISLWCYTNCEEVELFINDKSLGKQTLNNKESLHLEWKNLKYEPGVLKAVGLRKGREVISILKTTKIPHNLKLNVYEDNISVGDLLFATVEVIDIDGAVVPTAATEVEFEGSVGLQFIATDNGDPTLSDFKKSTVETLSGKAVAIFRAIKSGSNNVKASFVNSKGKKVVVSTFVNIIECVNEGETQEELEKRESDKVKKEIEMFIKNKDKSASPLPITKVIEKNENQPLFINATENNGNKPPFINATENNGSKPPFINAVEKNESKPPITNTTEETVSKPQIENATEETVSKPPIKKTTEKTTSKPPVKKAAEKTTSKPPVKKAAEKTASKPPVRKATEKTATKPPIKKATEKTATKSTIKKAVEKS